MNLMNLRVFSTALVAAACLNSISAPDYSVAPGADLLFRVNLKGLQSSPLFKEFDESSDDPEMNEKIFKATGLRKEDVLGLSASVVLDGVTEESMADPTALMASLPLIGQFHLAKAVTQDQLLKGLATMVEEGGAEKKPVIEEKDGLMHIGGDVGEPSFFGAVSPDGKSLFMGLRAEDVKQAMARATAAKPMGVSAELAKVLDPGAHFSLALVLPATLQAKIGDQIKQMGEGPDQGQAAQAAMFAPFAGLKSASISAKLNEADADFGLALDLGTDANAIAANQTLSMFAMMLGSQMGAAGQKLKFAPEGSVVKLKMNLTKAEMEEASKGAGGGAPEPEPAEPVPAEPVPAEPVPAEPAAP